MFGTGALPVFDGSCVWTSIRTHPPKGDNVADTLNAGDSLGAGQSINSNSGAYALTLQDDGNLVLSEGGNAVWASSTNGSGTVKATVQDDGNFVL